MRTLPLVLCFLVLGCAEISGLSDYEVRSTTSAGGGGAAGGGGGGGAGGEAGGGGTTALGPFETIRLVAALDAQVDRDDPSFTPDALELYFNSTFDILRSVRGSTDEPWGAPAPVNEINDAGAEESDPVIAPNGLELFFRSDRDGSRDIFVSTRASRSGSWGAPTSVSALNTSGEEAPCGLSADGLTLLLARANDFFVATRPDGTGQSWSNPVALDALNTSAIEGEIWLSPDGLRVYFRRADEIYRARRTFSADEFGNQQTVDEINALGFVGDPWLTPDERYLMFSVGQNDRRIWEAFRGMTPYPE